MEDNAFLSWAPQSAYLLIVEKYFLDDDLDAAMQVVKDAFENVGWPAGSWTAFYNELSCEFDARQASSLHEVEDKLTIELNRSVPDAIFQLLRNAALEARDTVAGKLKLEFERKVMITIFLPDAPLDFIVGSHGYISHKTPYEKICLPYGLLDLPSETLRALVHEYAHVASYELAHTQVPHWLDEGLATYISDDVATGAAMRSIMLGNVESEHLLSTSHLESALGSANIRKESPGRVWSAYQLSGSLVEWWVDHYGLDSVRDALVRISKGEDTEHAIRHAAGISLQDMESSWRGQL